MFSNVENEEKKLENQKETISLSGCFPKEWVSLTNESEKVETLTCYLCNQIANNGMELCCDEHENVDQVYLVGEECLQKYLKLNNEKCPIEQHDYCEFSQNRIVRKLVSELLVICPRQFDLKKGQSNEETKSREEDNELNSNSISKSNCDFKGKIKDLKDHLDKSCNLIPIKQVISSKIVMSESIETLQNMIKDLQSQIQDSKLQIIENKKQIKKMKENENKQIEELNVNSFIFQMIFYLIFYKFKISKVLKKDQQIIGLTNDIQQLKTEMNDLKQQQNEKLTI
ncbi:viral A-type inclusion protein [Reticulomyxa filosa]|uniref:Viral A-type inclusion protein n=1 Tax=Reticulomyxa filosa TaxID=46433 RepID=X6LRW1_RETFI|nr:viral A-type inclusion protein [Reticulomyxa filosa]|eukprot:ETO04633.1 viral A-type inclusion protein [Reticulomyxa filosa]